MADLRPIRTEAEHATAIAEIYAFDDESYEAGTVASDRLDVLVMLVKAYEASIVPVPHVDPVDILNHAFTSMSRSQRELADLLGSAPRASEIMNRKRPLTLDMIRTISEAWHIPIAALTGSYALAREYA